MSTILLVAEREIRQKLRSRLFLVVTALLAAVLAVGAAVPGALDSLFGADEGAEGQQSQAAETEATPREVVVAGELPTARRTAIEAALGGEVTFTQVADVAAAEEALRNGAAFAAVDGGERLLAPAAAGPFASAVPTGVTEALGTAIALEEAGAGAEQVAGALAARPVPVDIVETGGGVDPETAAGRFAVAYAGTFMLYLVLVLFASQIANGVVEEKGSRIVELLLPAIPARHLMTGKLLGLGIVGTLQVAVLVAPALLITLVRHPGLLPPGVGGAIVALIAFFVLGFMLYSGVTAGLSSLAARAEDVQAVLIPVWAVLIGAFFLAFPTLNAPDSTLAVVATYLPFSAPFVVPVRMALVDLPVWEAALSGLVILATSGLLTLLAARLYENSILRGGGRVAWRTAWRGDR